MSNLTNYGASTVEIEVVVKPGEIIEPCQECLPWSVRIVGLDDEIHFSTGIPSFDFVVSETHAIGCPVSQMWGKCHEGFGVSILEPCFICAATKSDWSERNGTD